MKSAITTKPLQLPLKLTFHVVSSASLLSYRAQGWAGWVSVGWAVSQTVRVPSGQHCLMQQQVHPHPWESRPLPEPFCCSSSCFTLAQSCDKTPSEKVAFSPLMCPRASSLIFFYVCLLRVLGRSRRCFWFNFAGLQSPPCISSAYMHCWRWPFHFFLELFSPSF